MDVESPEQTPEDGTRKSRRKGGGFFSAVATPTSPTNKDELPMSSIGTMDMLSPQSSNPELVALINAEGTGPGYSPKTAKEMNEHLYRDLFKLYMREADEQERIGQMSERHELLREENEQTRAKIQQKQQLLRAFEDTHSAALEIKKLQALNAEEKAVEKQKELEEHKQASIIRTEDLEAEVREWKSKSLDLKRTVYYLESLCRGEDPAPGPYWLRFLDSEHYHLISAMIIMSNLLTIYLQMTHPHLHFKALNNTFLAFYVIELTLQLAHKHKFFFFDRQGVHWWNIMDASIVVVGVLEFLISMLFASNASWLSGLRMLRLFRLARAVKIVRMFAQDMSWAEGHNFQTFMIGIIFVNTIVMGFQCQYEGLAVWKYLDTIFLFIYVFELVVHMKLQGFGFFCNDFSTMAWNWLDFIIVLGGVVSIFIMPGIQGIQRAMGMAAEPDERLGQAMKIMRMVRLIRILRLVKLIKSVPPLYTLVIGIAKAMQGMGWVMVLTLGVLYTCALVGVQLVGKGAMLPSDLADPDAVKATFEDIPQAIFNLFMAMNADLDAFEPLLTEVPSTKYVFMVFMIVTNWAIFSILTAVVSDNMAKVTEQHNDEVAQQEAAFKRELRNAKLEMLFRRLDCNGDGRVTLVEFHKMLKDDETCAELLNITGLRPDDLEDIFELIAQNKSLHEADRGAVLHLTFQEFGLLLDRQSETVTLRGIMAIEKRLESIEASLGKKAKTNLMNQMINS